MRLDAGSICVAFRFARKALTLCPARYSHSPNSVKFNPAARNVKNCEFPLLALHEVGDCAFARKSQKASAAQ